MGSAAGSGSESRDKLAGAVTAPQGVFPQAQQGWTHPQPKPETGGQMKSPQFGFPCSSPRYFLTDLFFLHWNTAVQGTLLKGPEAPCPLAITEIPSSKPRIPFVWLLGIQAVVFTVHLFHTDTDRKAQPHQTHLCCGKGNKVLDSPHATLVLVHSHLLWSTEIICSTPQLSPRPVKDLEHQNKKKKSGFTWGKCIWNNQTLTLITESGKSTTVI